MKKVILFIFWCTLIITFPNKCFSQYEQRIQASYLIAFGRTATSSELNYWLGRGNFTISQLMDFHKPSFTYYPNLHKASITRSYLDALGRLPVENEMKYWLNRLDNYTELLNYHLQFLKANNREKEELISLSYKTVFNREPQNAEKNFWKKQGHRFF